MPARAASPARGRHWRARRTRRPAGRPRAARAFVARGHDGGGRDGGGAWPPGRRGRRAARRLRRAAPACRWPRVTRRDFIHASNSSAVIALPSWRMSNGHGPPGVCAAAGTRSPALAAAIGSGGDHAIERAGRCRSRRRLHRCRGGLGLAAVAGAEGGSPASSARTSTRAVPVRSHAELHRRGVAQVDDAAGMERAAVVDAHDHDCGRCRGW